MMLLPPTAATGRTGDWPPPFMLAVLILRGEGVPILVEIESNPSAHYAIITSFPCGSLSFKATRSCEAR